MKNKLLLLAFLLAGCQSEVVTYQQNEMVNGCVMQKSHDRWIRTCG